MTENISRFESSSLERIIPEELRSDETTGRQTLRLHVERYEFAQEYLRPGRVLDLACGVGYGTKILASSGEVSEALGVDISQEAIDYAARHYGSERIKYLCCSALDFRPQQTFENIISLETIEHVDDPRAVFAHLVSLITPGGRLIASVPVTPSVDANPHHRSNFSVKKFMNLGKANFLVYVECLLQVQQLNPIAVLSRREYRTSDLRAGIVKFYLTHPSHLALRLWSILRDGFVNKYLTVVWEKPKE